MYKIETEGPRRTLWSSGGGGENVFKDHHPGVFRGREKENLKTVI